MTRQQKQYERGNSCSTFYSTYIDVTTTETEYGRGNSCSTIYSTYLYRCSDNRNSMREGTAVVVFTRHICLDDRAAGPVNERELLFR